MSTRGRVFFALVDDRARLSVSSLWRRRLHYRARDPRRGAVMRLIHASPLGPTTLRAQRAGLRQRHPRCAPRRPSGSDWELYSTLYDEAALPPRPALPVLGVDAVPAARTIRRLYAGENWRRLSAPMRPYAKPELRGNGPPALWAVGYH